MIWPSALCHQGQCVWLVDRLVEAGLVDRRAIPGDRRSNALHLTEAGRNGRTGRNGDTTPVRWETVGKLPPQDLEMLDRVISRWRDTIRALEQDGTTKSADD